MDRSTYPWDKLNLFWNRLSLALTKLPLIENLGTILAYHISIGAEAPSVGVFLLCTTHPAVVQTASLKMEFS